MKFFTSFLPVAASFFGFSIAGIIEDRGYEVVTKKHLYGIFSPHYQRGLFCVDIIGIDATEKTASIYFMDNESESDHKDKLSLTEIYTALCEKNEMGPNDMNWLIVDVRGDEETDDAIGRIRSGRNLGPHHEVALVPSDEEWDLILGTQYYQTVQQLTNKEVHSIILRHRYDKNLWGKAFSANRIGFSFLPVQDVNSEAEAGMPFDDEEQRAAIKALFDEE
ncbi:hypothetical protein HOO65_090178 [Ceratocystis lukuohia]|uniref:Uncharacterized protein n=1 Tax=Ceratocystis lukuohia TaxID=2019550 RepID=A0ABR4M9G7_9PEZI